MQWCNCGHDQKYDIMSNVNNCYHDGHSTCCSCGNIINNDDMIILLVKEVKRLSEIMQVLESEKQERETIKINEEFEKMEAEKIAEKNLDKQTERFEMMDL